jgi:hypothetical protein
VLGNEEEAKIRLLHPSPREIPEFFIIKLAFDLTKVKVNRFSNNKRGMPIWWRQTKTTQITGKKDHHTSPICVVRKPSALDCFRKTIFFSLNAAGVEEEV